MSNSQKISWGLFNNQTINNIVVDQNYLQHLLTFENNPSDVNAIVLELYKSITATDDEIESWDLPPEIEDKISHNNVVTYKEIIITEYSENGYFISEAYKALDDDVPGRKKYFLKYINSIYRKIIGDLTKNNAGEEKMVLIRTHSDYIITQVINILLLNIAANTKLIEHISKEIIQLNVVTIVCHAFVDCKVLENPNKK